MKRGLWLALFFLPFYVFAADTDTQPITFASGYETIKQELAAQNYQDALLLVEATISENRQHKAILAALRGKALWGLGNIIEAQETLLLAYQSRVLPPDELRDVLRYLIRIVGERKMHRASAAFTSHYLKLEPDDMQYRLAYVRTLFKLDQCKQVLIQHRILLKRLKEPTEDIWIIKARCQEKLGQFIPLLNTLTAIESRFGLTPDLVRTRARVFFKAKDYQKSYQILRGLIASGRGLVGEDFLMMADAAYRNGEIAVAANAVDIGLASRVLPPSRQHYKWLLKYQFESQQWHKALETSMWLNAKPEMQVLKVRAHSALNVEEFETCSDAASLAISIGAGSDNALWKLHGYCAMKAGQYSQAEKAFREWGKREPNSDAQYWLSTLDVLKRKR
ncbi:hypothetical protein CS022_06280 [Veronia nyctiphanis]|uniref:Uncharacterized protein n=1 Tax=Veronia nyctiphanis TaxID=1278244 RepID=A0A4Q0YXH4_9GAMM|nr:hypothetical protein [Veronia nyctiphanis]RXJ73899.1 hypothetical protein CS022_06280 [Veronia nyctiphanis]